MKTKNLKRAYAKTICMLLASCMMLQSLSGIAFAKETSDEITSTVDERKPLL